MKEATFTKKITKSGDSLAINIPKDVVDALDLKLGEIVDVKLTKREVVSNASN